MRMYEKFFSKKIKSLLNTKCTQMIVEFIKIVFLCLSEIQGWC